MSETELLTELLTHSNLNAEVEIEPLLDDTGNAKLARSDTQNFTPEDRLVSGLAVLALNMDEDEEGVSVTAEIQRQIAAIDELINIRMDQVLHNKEFQKLEGTWRGIDELLSSVPSRSNVKVSVMDVTKDELEDDLDTNAVDVSGSVLFDRLYVKEYDQYGGEPYGCTVGLYEFGSNPKDISMIQTMAKIANAAHAPFLTNIGPQFFGFETIAELDEVRDLSGHLAHPRFSRWNQFRETDEAAYVGLTFPRYISRLPYHPIHNPCKTIQYRERAEHADSDYTWSPASILMAKNMVRSFLESGWCQYIRGPKGGGRVTGLPVHTFDWSGQEEQKTPVETVIPDFRELELANNGIIPLIYKKNTGEAAFFSVQSAKFVPQFKDPKDSENAALVANLSYTLSITRIAHYVRCVMRDNIGSEADASTIQSSLQEWLMGRVTTVKNPSDLTMRVYPFKAAEIEITEKPGQIGQYNCSISVLPHLQFEGMDVELRLESRLG